MAKPENSKPGCFSAFLQVLLCAGNGTSPPVYPSDHVVETEQPVHPKRDKPVGDDAVTPGVVARLMGLDSLPKNTNWVVKGATPGSVPRSRSVNFVDYLLEFDLGHANANANHHRRVKTSASFREVPPALSVQRHNRDLLVLLGIDDDNNARKVQEGRRAGLGKLERGLGEPKQRKRQGNSKSKEVVGVKKKEGNQGKKNKKISKLRNEPRRVPSASNSSSKVRNHSEAKDFSKSCNCSYRYSDAGSRSSSCSSSPLQKSHKKELVETKIRNTMKNQQSPKKIETEHSLENLSPVSVLDIDDYPFLYGTDFLEGTSSLASKSKWKSPLPLSLDNGFEEKASNNKGYDNTDANREAEYYSELMLKLRSLTEKDIRESDCTSKRMCETESFEEIYLVFEHKIFDLLLYEVVNEVVELSS